jgi:hypothetical protein
MGVADMPIQTLKLLNIHPDARASKKGKERATGDNASSTAESSGAGRPPTTRTETNDTDVSIDSTAPVRSNTDKTAAQSPGTPGKPTHRQTFMSQAFAESAQGSRSSSRERARALRRETSNTATGIRTNSGTATPPPDKPGPDLQESMTSAVDTGKGLARIIGAGFKSPMDFSLNVAKGLHNVPKLYGAEVRQVDKVTDFQSGVRTAAKVGFIKNLCLTDTDTDPGIRLWFI